MGGTSKTTQQSSQSLAPYSEAAGPLNGIIGSIGNLAGGAGSLNPTESGAINQVISNANGTPNYAPQINAGTYGLLNGGGANNNNGAISGNLSTLQNGIVGQTASGANIGKNPALQAQLDQIAADTTNATNSAWAAAGRDGSPGNAQALARGIAAGEAPVIANQYNTDTSNALNAAQAQYGAGNTTYGILNQNQNNANANFQNGVAGISSGLTAENAAPTAALQAASQQFGIPADQLTKLLSVIAPTAAQFGTQSGQATGTSTMSGAQQFGLLAGGLKNIGDFAFGA